MVKILISHLVILLQFVHKDRDDNEKESHEDEEKSKDNIVLVSPSILLLCNFLNYDIVPVLSFVLVLFVLKSLAKLTDVFFKYHWIDNIIYGNRGDLEIKKEFRRNSEALRFPTDAFCPAMAFSSRALTPQR